MTYGPGETLWIASTRDRDRYSYIDIFRSNRRVGVVRVVDRLISYNVHEDEVVVLVERRHSGPSGMRPLGIDWYRVDPDHPAFTAMDEQLVPVSRGDQSL